MRTLLRRSLASMILQSAFVVCAQAQVRYQVIDLGLPDFTGVLVESGVHDARVTNVAAAGINEHGVVVGTYSVDYKYVHNGQTYSRSVHRGFLWENGQFADLGALYNAQYTAGVHAADINEQGQVVGTSNMGPMETSPGSGNFVYPSHAYRWSGAPTDLGTDTQPWHGSSAIAINNSGVVVGSTGVYSDYAAKWEGGTISRLPALVPAHKAVANGINDAGWIVGQSIEVSSWRSKAVLWRPGQAGENLDPTPLNVQESEAIDINEQGRIVGAVRQGLAWFPVRWESGQQTLLFAYVPQGGARPGAVNNSGHVVGNMSYSLPGSFGRWHAFLWTDTLNDPAMLAPHYELERMIPPNTGWELWYAADINDRGYIVGSGRRRGEDRAFLLIPEDDPTADIDADSNKDGVIDDNDDGIELSMPDAAVIKPNVDDSDNDGMLDADNDVLEGDRAKYSRLIVRRPTTVAPTLAGEARLSKIAGPGSIRVFIDDGAVGTVVLAPGGAQGPDFWAQLATGDLTLLAEGLEEGGLILELELRVGANRHTDRIALMVPSFVLELEADEPFMDADRDSFASGFLDVPADFVAEDYQGAESAGVLNLFAHLQREDEAGSEQEPPERELKWKVEPIGANQSMQPGLRDLLLSQPDFLPEITGVVRAYLGRVQLRFSFPHPAELDPATGQPRPWVKAGDAFKVTATMELPGGRALTKERSIRIVPGEKFFHVTEPAGVLPDTLWRLSDSQFEQLAVTPFEPPMNSAETKTLSVLLLDQYRNPLAEHTEIKLRLEGSGYLGMLDTGAAEPDTDAASTVLVGADGLAQIRMTQTSFASCPWQTTPELDDGVGIVGLFATRTDPLARSMLKRDAAYPPSLGRVRLERRQPTVSAGFATPDIYRKHTRDFEVAVFREATATAARTPVVGVHVSFSSLNGKLGPVDPLQWPPITDSAGIARVRLTHENARPDEDILVIASLADDSVSVSPPGMRWISSGPTVVKPEHRILAGDKTANGFVQVEALDDTGEALAFPGAAEGDGFLNIPYYTRSRVDATGLPGHIYKVDIVDSAAWLLSARFPLDDALAQQTTPDVRGGLDARYSNTTLDLSEKKEGAGSFEFNANGLVTVPGSPAVDLANGLLIELWANPASGHRGVLLERAGQYKLELIDSGPQLGHVRLRVEGRNATGQLVGHDLVSARPLPAGRWSFVEARYDGASVRLGTGEERDRLEMAFRTFPAVQSVTASTPVLVGAGYVGRLDDLRFTTGGHALRIAIATGVDPGGTITLDQNGRGHFFVESTGNWNPDRYLPASILVELSGSEKAAGEVQFTHSNIIGQLIAGGKAFLLGTESLGKDAGWFARATAWASENLPLLSDLRTLAMELYKASSGCDRVSMLNVTFAAVGLVADVATFGTAGAGVRGMAATLKVVAKAFLKEFAQNTAMAALAQAAISAYVRELTLQTTAAGHGNPPGWVLEGHRFMESLTTWAQQGLASALDNSLTSLESMLSWSAIHKELGVQATREMFEGIQRLGAELEAAP